MRFPHSHWRKTALAGFFGIAAAMTAAAPAFAHHVFTRCDSDGDRCWRVICDDDGDDCHRLPSDWSDRDRTYWNNSQYDYDRYYRDHYYDRDNYRRWVCDRDGDRCHWESNNWWDRWRY